MAPVTPIPNVPYVFDRRRTQHPWHQALDDLVADPTRRFVAANWRMDHRVAPAREDNLLAAPEFTSPLHGEDWWQGCGNYFQRALCQPTRLGPAGRRSVYLEPPNASNVIPRGRIPGHEQLIHVGSLNAMLWRLASAQHPAVGLKLRFPDVTGRSLPTRPAGAAASSWSAFGAEVDAVAEAVNGRDLAVVKELAALLTEALGETQPPWWAGFAQELAPLVDAGDATGLGRALGLGHLDTGEWLFVWRYEVALVYQSEPEAELYRPTAIEANDNPCHYPSPPSYGYGITMDLGSPRPGACREVIHPPLRGRLAADACVAELCRVASAPLVDHNQLSDLRTEHRRCLERDHPRPEDTGWIERHRSLP